MELQEYNKYGSVILIGELHEIKESVRNNTGNNPLKQLHDLIEHRIIDYIYVQSNNFRNIEEFKILFVNEGKDENERNKNIMKRLKKITLEKISNKNFSKLIEFNKNNFKIRNNQVLYYTSTFVNYLKMIDYKKQNPKYNYDFQYEKNINVEYFNYILAGHGLDLFLTKNIVYKLSILINIVVYKTNEFNDNIFNYEETLKTILQEYLELILDIDINEIKHIFTHLLKLNIEERLNRYELYSEILRSVRDSDLVKRISNAVKINNFNIIVMYFGLNHSSNLKYLINIDENLHINPLSIDMNDSMNDSMNENNSESYCCYIK